MDEPAEGAASPRIVEYYGTIVELSAAIIVRSAGGWRLLSAGYVSADKLWVEFEQDSAQ
ncbi:MAG: hypothetical protein LC789_06380 [Actinobacteria bacterium]|nr:hypothetical protein [Actinomycetota bacterium]